MGTLAPTKSFEGLTRMARVSRWDPERVVDWNGISRSLPEHPADWFEVWCAFYAGESQGLRLIRRLGAKAAKRFQHPAMAAYYETQADDEARHLILFERYLRRYPFPFRKENLWMILLANLAGRGPLAVERWILGTHFTESLAAAVFQKALQTHLDPLGKALVRVMLKDESRHIAATRLALEVLEGNLGSKKRDVLRRWWYLFLKLATWEVRRLGVFGESVGLNSKTVWEAARRRMDFSTWKLPAWET